MGRDLAHWNVFFDAEFSPMDGNDWVDNGDGSFTLDRSFIDEATFKRSTEGMPYNDLDLYSMGLLDPNQVAASFVIENPTLEDGRRLRSYQGLYVEIEDPVTGTWSGPYYLGTDTVIRGTRRNITLSDITALEGLRNPAYPSAQKDFKVAFINVTNEEDTSIDQLETSQKLNRFKDSFLDFFNDMTRNLGNLLTPAAAPSALGAMSTLEMGTVPAFSGTVPISTPSPLFSHFNGEPFEPIDRLGLIQRNFEAGLSGLELESPISVIANPVGVKQSQGSLRRFAPRDDDWEVLLGVLRDLPSLSLSPVMLPASLLSNLAAEVTSLQKPILYSDWKRDQGIKTTDPFAVDPVLSSPLPLLVNPETIVPNVTVIAPARQHFGGSPEEAPSLRGSVPSDADLSAGSMAEATSEAPQPFQVRPSSNPKSQIQNPKFPFTPLIWDALAPRSAQKGMDEKEKDRSDILSFIRWRGISLANRRERSEEEKNQKRISQTSTFQSPSLLLSISMLGAPGILANNYLTARMPEYLNSGIERTKYYRHEIIQKGQGL